MTQFNLDNTTAGVEGYYDIDGDVLHIHFYGTNHKTDWRTNILGVFWRKNGFHAGWYRDALQCYPLIASLATKHKDKTILFTGHSYGAAIAVIFAYIYNSQDPKCITYGQPGCASIWRKWSMRDMDIVNSAYTKDGLSLAPLWLIGLFQVGKKMWEKSERFRGFFQDFYWYHQPVLYKLITEISL